MPNTTAKLVSAAFLALVATGACVAIATARDAHRPSVASPLPSSEIVAPSARFEAGSTPPPVPPPHEPAYRTLRAPEILGDGVAQVAIVPGKDVDLTRPPPLITALHCTCWAPEDMCSFMSSLADGRGTLVCPRGNGSCQDGEPDWVGENPVRAAHAEKAVALVERTLEEPDGTGRRDVLVGFSRGAFVARDLAYASHDRWKALVLIGAAITPDARKLKAAGIERVLMAAPDRDGAAPTMRGATDALNAAGLPARFVRLGPGYHGMPSNGPALLEEGLDWVMARPAS
jgi:predicted esterase